MKRKISIERKNVAVELLHLRVCKRRINAMTELIRQRGEAASFQTFVGAVKAVEFLDACKTTYLIQMQHVAEARRIAFRAANPELIVAP